MLLKKPDMGICISENAIFVVIFFLSEYEFCAILVVYRSLFWHTFWVGIQTKITLNFELVLGPKYLPGGHGFNNLKFYYHRIVALWSHKL